MGTIKRLFKILTLIHLLNLSACSKSDKVDEFILAPENDEELSGGLATSFDASQNAFGFQISNLSDNDGLLFFVGNSFFNQNWVTSPASTTARDGLGPLFNARACSSCHFKDGRGRPPEFTGELAHGLLLRLSIGNEANGNPLPDPNYGGQIQDQSISDIDTEATFEIVYQEISGSYPDGASYSLRKPTYTINNLVFGELSPDIKISPRVGNHMSGLGLLEAISETTVLSFADENDSNSDGISGKPNYVWDVQSQSTKLGRFGWKANQPSLLQQVAGAFSGDLGITTSIFPNENCPPNVICDEIANGGSPEIPDDDLQKVVLYSSTLAVPARRNWENITVLEGKQLFEDANCIACHIPKIETGTHPTIDALSNQTIRPYTDMLLHDMGDDLSDNRQDFLASGNEWRTPPLWGIGLIETVNNHTYLLHDGRGRNIEEAILWHGGEAIESKEYFMALNAADRQKLITFIESL